MRPIPNRLLPHSVTWRARQSVDDHGKPTYGAATTVSRCMDQRGGGISGSSFGGRIGLDIDGEIAFPKGKLIVTEANEMSVFDEITLPDGLVARILHIQKPTGPSLETHHLTVVYG